MSDSERDRRGKSIRFCPIWPNVLVRWLSFCAHFEVCQTDEIPDFNGKFKVLTDFERFFTDRSGSGTGKIAFFAILEGLRPKILFLRHAHHGQKSLIFGSRFDDRRPGSGQGLSLATGTDGKTSYLVRLGEQDLAGPSQTLRFCLWDLKNRSKNHEKWQNHQIWQIWEILKNAISFDFDKNVGKNRDFKKSKFVNFAKTELLWFSWFACFYFWKYEISSQEVVAEWMRLKVTCAHFCRFGEKVPKCVILTKSVIFDIFLIEKIGFWKTGFSSFLSRGLIGFWRQKTRQKRGR